MVETTTPNNIAATPAPGPEGEVNKHAAQSKDTKKIVRLLTVVAYMMSVSMAALMLSAYYIFLWNPKEHRPGPLRLVDPCPECYLTPAAGSLEGVSGLQDLSRGLGINGSEVAETPRALPAQEQPTPPPTTPLSRLVKSYLELRRPADNDTLDLS